MIKRAISLAAAIAVLAAAAAVCVFAAAFALYALLRYSMTPAGAAAVVALVFAAIAALVGVIMLRKGAPPADRRQDQSVTTKLFDLAREKPLIAAAAAAAAGFVVLRNPNLMTAAFTAAMAGRAKQAERRTRGR